MVTGAGGKTHFLRRRPGAPLPGDGRQFSIDSHAEEALRPQAAFLDGVAVFRGDAAAVGGQFAAASVVFAEFRDEFRRREDRQVVSEPEEVLVAGDEECAPADGEREQIVVIGVR